MLTEDGLPFKALLTGLVSEVPGATGAIFLASDGEAVQWHADSDESRLRLRAAYAGVILDACRNLALNSKAGELRTLVLQFQGAALVVQWVGEGYFVVLELAPNSNVAEAVHRLKPVAERLRAELDM
jgi:predicted regulator of Ras-like GTPase activity (Roadblock/LC7/MglB family)